MPEVIPGCRLCLLVAGSGYGVTRPVQVRRKAREESDPRGTVPNQETLITRFPKAPKETNLGDLAPAFVASTDRLMPSPPATSSVMSTPWSL